MHSLLPPSSFLQRPLRVPARQHCHAPAALGICHCKPASVVRSSAAAAEPDTSSSSAPAAAVEAAGAGAVAAPASAEAAITSSTVVVEDEGVKKRSTTGEQTKQRLRKKSNNWRDNNQQGVPSRGLVRITEFSKAPGAAACVAADLKGPKGLTRVVAITPEQAAKAVQSIHLAGLMVNNQYVWKGGDALKQEQSDGQAPAEGLSDRQATLEDRPVTEAANDTAAAAAAAAGAAGTGGRVVLFQPVMVQGVLVNPPELPEGALALYATTVDAGNSVLCEIAARRASLQQQQHAAAPATAAASEAPPAPDITSEAATETTAARTAGSTGKPGLVRTTITVTRKSSEDKVAYSISNSVQHHGWVVMEVVGNDSVLLLAVKALLKARGLLYNRAKQDAAVTVLDYKRTTITVTTDRRDEPDPLLQQEADDAAEQPTPVGQTQQQQQEVADATAKDQGAAGGPDEQSVRKISMMCRTFLAVRCAKNRPADLTLISGDLIASDHNI